MLLLNSYSSHLTKEFAEYCEEKNIHLLAIPPHTSHFLQPLDVVLFQPFKHHHRLAVEMAVRTGCTNFNTVEFLHALHQIRTATFKSSSILSGWAKTGLIPYNPEVVLTRLRRQTAVVRPSTPPPTTLQPPRPRPTVPRTPDTPRSLQITINRVRSFIIEQPNRVRNPLLMLCKSARKNAVLRSLAEEDLHLMQAAVRARAKRQKTDQRVVQKGGLISAVDGRLKVSQRVQKEAEKAGRAAARAVKKQAKEDAAQRAEALDS